MPRLWSVRHNAPPRFSEDAIKLSQKQPGGSLLTGAMLICTAYSCRMSGAPNVRISKFIW